MKRAGATGLKPATSAWYAEISSPIPTSAGTRSSANPMRLERRLAYPNDSGVLLAPLARQQGGHIDLDDEGQR
jgi:hypothetical protein